MVVVRARSTDFASLELSFNGSEPGSGIFGPEFNEAQANIANTDRFILIL